MGCVVDHKAPLPVQSVSIPSELHRVLNTANKKPAYYGETLWWCWGERVTELAVPISVYLPCLDPKMNCSVACIQKYFCALNSELCGLDWLDLASCQCKENESILGGGGLSWKQKTLMYEERRNIIKH